jgi:hypothetical protein
MFARLVQTYAEAKRAFRQENSEPGLKLYSPWDHHLQDYKLCYNKVMSRVSEAWSPEHSTIIIEGQRDAELVVDAFHRAISYGSEDATELYNRRLHSQVHGKKDELAGLAFDTSEAKLVIDVLASYTRELTKSQLLTRRRATSLIGLTAVQARHEFSTVTD